MGFLSFFENKMEDTLEGVADKMFDSPISPVQIAKKAEKQMRREKTVGAGKQFAPTLYTVLVNPQDDARLMGYYPTLAGETETYLRSKAAEQGLVMDGQPLVRFFVDEGLKKGKFDVVAESVAAPIVSRLRHEEMQRYNSAAQQLSKAPAQRQRMQSEAQDAFEFAELPGNDSYDDSFDDSYDEPVSAGKKPPLPYVPEDELDYSIDYGEYTFDSHDFEDYRDQGGDFEAPSAAEDREGKRLNRPARQPHEIAADQAEPDAAAGAAAAGAAGAGAAVAAGAAAGAAAARKAERSTAPRRTQNQVTGPCLFDLTNNRTHKLTKNLLTVGRESTCDIVIPDINASREHAQLRYQTPGVWWIVDARSTNGTLVNGRETSRSELHDGDIITIGMSELQFQEH